MLNGFHFDDDRIFNHYVKPINGVKFNAFVNDWQILLRLSFQPTTTQSTIKASSYAFSNKPGPKMLWTSKIAPLILNVISFIVIINVSFIAKIRFLTVWSNFMYLYMRIYLFYAYGFIRMFQLYLYHNVLFYNCSFRIHLPFG